MGGCDPSSRRRVKPSFAGKSNDSVPELDPLALPHVDRFQTSPGGGCRLCHAGAAVKRFAYWRDPLFLAACGLYMLNRSWIKPWSHSPFLRGQFNDCLLIPCALPLVLWAQRRLDLRRHDGFPDAIEIGFHLGVWSLVCEVVGPRVMHVTGDLKDVVAYAAGGLFAWAWWRWRSRVPISIHEL